VRQQRDFVKSLLHVELNLFFKERQGHIQSAEEDTLLGVLCLTSGASLTVALTLLSCLFGLRKLPFLNKFTYVRAKLGGTIVYKTATNKKKDRKLKAERRNKNRAMHIHAIIPHAIEAMASSLVFFSSFLHSSYIIGSVILLGLFSNASSSSLETLNIINGPNTIRIDIEYNVIPNTILYCDVFDMN